MSSPLIFPDQSSLPLPDQGGQIIPQQQVQGQGQGAAPPQKPSLFRGILAGALAGLAGSSGATSFGGGLGGGVRGAQQQEAQQAQQAQDQAAQQQQAQQNQQKQDIANQESQARLANMQLNNRQLSQKLHELDPHDPAFVQKQVGELADQGDAGLKAGALLKTPEFKSAAEAEQYVHDNHIDQGNYQVRAIPFHNAKGELVYGGIEYDNSPSTADTKVSYTGPDGKTSDVTIPAGTPKNKIAEFQTAAALQGVNAQFKTAQQKAAKNQEDVDAQAQSLVDGKLAPSQLSKRSQTYGATLARADQLAKAQGKPGFDAVAAETQFQSGKALNKDITSGPTAINLQAISTARNHMATFKKLAGALGNGDVQALNSAKQEFVSQFGGSAPTSFELAKAAFSGEVGKSFAGTNVTQGDRDELKEQISKASSPQQLMDAANTADELLAGKQHAIKQRVDKAQQGKADYGNNEDPFVKFGGKGR